ncbi:MAG: phosphoribosylglycinamide formyltransferase, partial [Actinobacteria bacterium]
MSARLVVLISGGGTNLQAILDACREGVLPAEVVGVISNRGEAYGLERARQAGVPAIALPKRKEVDRQAYDSALADQVAALRPDWVVLAGWL